jgi:hypothetical protein
MIGFSIQTVSQADDAGFIALVSRHTKLPALYSVDQNHLQHLSFPLEMLTFVRRRKRFL